MPKAVWMFVGVVILLGYCGLITPAAIAAPSPSSAASIVTPVTSTSGGSTLFKFSGSRPSHLGVHEGKLAPCPSSPNCVCSQSPESDAQHWIAPITYATSPSEAMARLKSIIQGMERTQVITESDRYLYVEFTSALMGFVDDVEFYIESETSSIQVRSASRLGQSDLGVNRQRIEAIRTQMLA